MLAGPLPSELHGRMSDSPKKRGLAFWAGVVFWSFVALTFIALYAMGTLDFAASRFARLWF